MAHSLCLEQEPQRQCPGAQSPALSYEAICLGCCVASCAAWLALPVFRPQSCVVNGCGVEGIEEDVCGVEGRSDREGLLERGMVL